MISWFRVYCGFVNVTLKDLLFILHHGTFEYLFLYVLILVLYFFFMLYIAKFSIIN